MHKCIIYYDETTSKLESLMSLVLQIKIKVAEITVSMLKTKPTYINKATH